MKIIGLIGGTGWLSTLEYYRLINLYANQKRGGLNFIKCILYSLDYGQINTLNQQNDMKSISNMLLQAAVALERAGAQCLVLCANTLHMFASELEENLRLPLLHVADATAQAIRAKGMGRIGLLGTKFTMEKDFYKRRLQKSFIQSIVPDTEQRDFIQRTILQEIMKGIFRPESKRKFISIIEDLSAKGAQGIILGCTEIPLLVKQEDCRIPLFNTLDIHARMAVDYALK